MDACQPLNAIEPRRRRDRVQQEAGGDEACTLLARTGSALQNPPMPGGQLSFFVYQQLGGEQSFREFWLHLGLPVVAVLGLAYALGMPFRRWQLLALGLPSCLAAAVAARVIR